MSQGKIAECNRFFHLGTRLSVGGPCRSAFNILSLKCLISFHLDCPEGMFRCDNGECVYNLCECFYDWWECYNYTYYSDGSDEDDSFDYCKLIAVP